MTKTKRTNSGAEKGQSHLQLILCSHYTGCICNKPLRTIAIWNTVEVAATRNISEVSVFDGPVLAILSHELVHSSQGGQESILLKSRRTEHLHLIQIC